MHLSLSIEDVALIREAMQRDGWQQSYIEEFGDKLLQKYLECWDQFVHFHWNEDWEEEYNHDIGCRYGLQIAIEYATPTTREKLENSVKPLDEVFKQKMKTSTFIIERNPPPPAIFKGRPYFWETNAII